MTKKALATNSPHKHSQLRLLSSSYTYVTEGDKELKSFNLDHDEDAFLSKQIAGMLLEGLTTRQRKAV
jgi:hypothetical protein